MTVQELIDILSQIEDKSKPVKIDIFDDEVKHGSNLLMRLNEGELTPDAFIKRVNGDRSF